MASGGGNDINIVPIPLDSVLDKYAVPVKGKRVVVGRMDLPFTVRIGAPNASAGSITRPVQLVDCDEAIDSIYVSTSEALAGGVIELWISQTSCVSFESADAAGPPRGMLYHAVPGGASLSGDQPNDLVKGFAARGFDLQGLNTGLGQNLVDATRGVGWRLQVPLASVTGDAIARVYGDPLNTQLPSPGSMLSTSFTVPAAVRSGFGLYAMETDVALAVTQGDPADDLSFNLSPSHISGASAAEFAGTTGYGICWATGLGPNYRLFAVESVGGLFLNLDTGIAATDGVRRRVKFQWGTVGGVVVLRAYFDGVLAAEQLGPIGALTAAQLGAFFTQNAVCGVEQHIGDGANEITAYVGFAGGLMVYRE
jgi:hypothetical protein